VASANVKIHTMARGASAPEKAGPRMRKHVDDQGTTKVLFAVEGEAAAAACVDVRSQIKAESMAVIASATTSHAPSARGECAEVVATVSVKSASASRDGLVQLATARKVQIPAWSRGDHMGESMTGLSVRDMGHAGVGNAFVTLLTQGLFLGTSMWEKNVKLTRLERDPAED